MYSPKKLPKFSKAIMLLMGLLATTVAMSATPLFDSNCGRCHGDGNTGTNIEGVVIPPVRDISFAGIKNSITPVPVPGSAAAPDQGHGILKTLYDFGGGITDQTFVDIAAELATLTPPACTPPQTLVNGVCTSPAPTPPAPLVCDDSANTPLCLNLPNQTGSLGSADSLDARSDVYKISCSKPGAIVSATVSGLTAENPAKLSIQVSRGGDISPVRTDTAGGDGVPSKAARLTKGPGVYKVKITKSKSSVPGAVQYDAAISCLNKKKAVVGSDVLIKSNQ